MLSLAPSRLHSAEFEHDACGVGFVAKINGARSHDVVARGLRALKGLAHRGAIDADAITGDGAGILTQIPIELFQDFLAKEGHASLRGQDLGVAMFFLPRNERHAQVALRRIVEEAAADQELNWICWRNVPVDGRCLGRKALETQPLILQALVSRSTQVTDEDFESRMFLIQKSAERRAAEQKIDGFYVCSSSSKTVVYKGLFNAPQLRRFYGDLKSLKFTSAFAIFHQRYSTNTFPTWHLAHPFRMLAHNGEINTIRANRNVMRAREQCAAQGVWREHMDSLRPFVAPGGSDSASFDNALQLLTLGGRSPLQAATIMMPPAWENDRSVTPEAAAFFRYHACMMEPWDGPAAIVFTDGRYVAAALDRNGLRPARYKIYDDGYVLLASEAGLVADFPGKVVTAGQLGPGRMIAIDLQDRKFLADRDVKALVTQDQSFRAWCDEHLIDLRTLAHESVNTADAPPAPSLTEQIAFGYDLDERELILTPLAEGKEPTSSMGDDTPLAILSRRPRLLYTYFKQLFAQVTNPPIDSIRERSVMSLRMFLGGRLRLFENSSASPPFAELDSPVLAARELAALFEAPAFHEATVRLECLFDAQTGRGALEPALRQLRADALAAAKGGARIVVLSDRGATAERAAIPMLLAVGSVHQHLVRAGLRLDCDIIAETGEARDVHQFASLIAFGANAVHPWLALEVVSDFAATGHYSEAISSEQARANYIKSLNAGLLKVMAKMGISTVLSYHGSQLFEALGIGPEVMDDCFTGAPSPIGGITYREIAEETLRRHLSAFPKIEGEGAEANLELHREGYYQPNKKAEGEFHGWNTKVVAAMNKFTRAPAENFEGWRAAADEHQPSALKDLLKLRIGLRPSIDVDEVEPIEEIRRRFTTAGMSLGALSPEAHETLAIAMNQIGGKSNSGEGGEDPARYSIRANGDLANSAIKQVASGRFGVTAEYLVNAKEIEIKMAQGAKPGEGGQLPGHKVSPMIARLRFSTPGVTLISPPPHHDVYSIEDLAQLIFDLKEVNPRAKVCVKLVACSGVGPIAAGVAKAYADVILISGHEGGTGASPTASIKNAGSAWEIGVAEAHQVLMMNGLRNRVVLRTDGGMKTGRDIVIAAILGAEEFNFGTAALIAAGCAMFRVCHLNTCPVGVATQREDLRAKFRGKPENVISFFNGVAEDVRRILAELGAGSLNEIIGRTELLSQIDDPANPKTRLLDLSRLLHNVDPSGEADRYHTRERNERFGSEGSLDSTIVQEARDVILGKSPKLVRHYVVTNANRDVATHVSGQIAYQRGDKGLAAGALDLSFTGSAGQSFGAFLVEGVRLTLRGEANDYVGKGMSGGEIIVRPKPEETFEWHTNCLVGNTCLYGATGGSLFVAGRAGERFAVRNSGATAVVDGVGDHGCEYMTGGVVVALNQIGKNFAAGMTGGLAFVHDERGELPDRHNSEMSSAERLTNNEEIASLRRLIERHVEFTDSPYAKGLLDRWATTISHLWKIVPHAASANTARAFLQFEALKVVAA
ncbi:MAG: hypothetical protein QOH39_1960 [Verrucomicrobiota bacterium]|jgi:glutamate synthase (NADPH/NADH) large chain/glutamate synthase (ferredoxin)